MIEKFTPALGGLAESCRFFVYLLTWDAEKRKYAKRPASSIADAAMTFRDAYAEAMRLRAGGQHATVGMRIDDGLFFADIDELPGEYATDARVTDIMAMLPPGLFVEWSSSKRGLHIVGRLAQPVEHGCRNTAQHLEFYSQARGIALNIDAEPSGCMDTVADVAPLVAHYFPPVPMPPPLSAPTAANGLTDDELIAKALASKPSAASVFGGRATFAQLWRGEADKNSENDAALACHLAYWTGRDAERVMRLMLASGMVRDKWRTHRTYLTKTIASAFAHCTAVYEPMPPPPVAQDAAPRVRNAADLMRQTFKPVQWAVNGILPEGVSILSGDPKLGKSWLVFQFCIAVAGGAPVWAGRAPEAGGDALYLDLEGNDRRLRRRLEKLMAAFPAGTDTARLHFATDWPRAEAGVTELVKWLREHPKCRIVVIDTVSAFRDNDPGRKSAYAHDYMVGEMLKPLAREFNCAIVLVMHNRKQAAGDVMQRVSGTQGMTGGVDNVLVLERTRGDLDAALSVDGRDIENPAQLALRFEGGPWRYIGNVEDVQRSKERASLVEAIKAQRGAATAREIADAMPDKQYGAVRKMLSRMVKRGELMNDGGIYTLAGGHALIPPPEPVTPPCHNSGHSL